MGNINFSFFTPKNRICSLNVAIKLMLVVFCNILVVFIVKPSDPDPWDDYRVTHIANNYLVTRIDTVDNTYITFCINNSDTTYKVVAKRNDTICGIEKIKLNSICNFELRLLADTYTRIGKHKIRSPPNVYCFGFDEGATICFEPENGIYALYKCVRKECEESDPPLQVVNPQ
jgi:hypothetical protein